MVEPTASALETAAPASERAADGLVRVGREVLGLAAIVLPEIVLTAVGAVVGLVIGVLAGGRVDG